MSAPHRRLSGRLGACSMSIHVLVAVLLTITGLASLGFCQGQVVRIGFVLDGPSDENAAVVKTFKSELQTLLDRDFQVEFPQDLTLIGDHTLAGASRNIGKLLSYAHSDLIITLGPLASLAVAQRDAPAKPVVAAFMPDPEVSGVPIRDGTSGVANLNYLIAPSALIRELEAFQEIVAFKKLCLLVDKGLLDALPRAKEAIQARTGHHSIGVVTVPVSGSARDVLSLIPQNVDAVYIVSLNELGASELSTLIAGLKERNLPSFSRRGRVDVERGVLAGLTPADWHQRLARRVAINVQDILLGRDAAKLPIAMIRREELVLNLETARATGVYPSFRLLTEAVVLNQDKDPVARRLSLGGVLDEAVSVNRDLLRSNFEVQAGREDVAQARSTLLPQLSASATASIIDQDRASAGFSAERTLSGSLNLTQTLWSEPAWANLSIQKSLQAARGYSRDRVRLDVALEAATVYLGILRAKTFEKILKNTLKTSRYNIELAEVRVSIGAAKRSEVLRWRTRIASDKSAVIRARAEREVKEGQLNRLLYRPIPERFSTEETDLNDPVLPNDPRGRRYLRDPWTFEIFRQFVAQRALETAPELQQVTSTIAAQERHLKSATRSFFTPTIAVKGELSERLHAGGVGSGAAESPFLGDGSDWSVGIMAILPVFTSGSRTAEVRQVRAELRGLETKREALAKQVDQRVHASLHVAAASHAVIELAKEAAQAAQENLAVVTDEYLKGTESINSLLDAQDAALSADLAVADATYSFMIDLMEVERAVGRLTFFAQPGDRDEWFRAVEEFFDRSHP